jgi:tRNA(fMet)-specific endonuclease VapC
VFLLDTNTCIYLFARTYPLLEARARATAAERLAISTVTLAELLVGQVRGYGPSAEALGAFLDGVTIAAFDEAAAQAYAVVPFRRGSYDRLIAAHALALGATLVTANIRDFQDVASLRCEDWTQP